VSQLWREIDAFILPIAKLLSFLLLCDTVELRLMSNTEAEGRLEIFHNGSWGTVCNDAFDDVDAQVACYSLGFGLVIVG